MENIHLKIEPTGSVVTLLQGTAPVNIEPKPFIYAGNIQTVAAWLSTKEKEVELQKAVVCVNYKNGSILLDLNVGQENGRYQSTVKGQLCAFPDLDAFRINKEYSWELGALANHCKFNRRYFLDKSVNMDVVSGLKSFKATVQREIEKTADDRGNHRRLDDKKVNTTLPEVFTLVMPLFEGEAPTDFDVELLVEEKEGVARVKLQSVSLLEKRETYIKTVIDEELKKLPKGITIIID